MVRFYKRSVFQTNPMTRFKITILIIFNSFLCFSLKAFSKLPPEKTIQQLHKEFIRAENDSAKMAASISLSRAYAELPGERAQDLRLALSFGQKALVIAKRFKFRDGEGEVYGVISQILREGNEKKRGKVYAEAALAALEGSTNALAKSQAYIELSNYYDISVGEQLGEKARLYELGTNYLAKTSKKLKYADALKFLGDLQNLQGKLEQALSTLQKSLEIYQSLGQTKLQDIYSLIGYVCMDMGKSQEALSYGLLAEKEALKYHDESMMLCTVYNRLAITYSILSEYGKMRLYFEKSYKIARLNHHLPSIVLLSDNLAKTYIRFDDPRKAVGLLRHAISLCRADQREDLSMLNTTLLLAYTMLKRFHEADICYKEVRRLLDPDRIPQIQLLNANFTLIKYFLETKRAAMAYPLIKYNGEIYKNNGDVKSMAMVFYYSFKADSLQKNFTGAIHNFQQYKFYSDSIAKRNQDKQLSQLQIQYDIEKKDKDLALKSKNIQLLTKESMLQKSTLYQAGLEKKIMVAGGFLLLIFLGIFYSRFRSKKRINQQLLFQQSLINSKNTSLQELVFEKDKLLTEKEWLLKEIHHRVKNNLQIVISLLNTQSAFLENDIALDAIRESQHRMHSISLIHQKLYQSENLSCIQMPSYINDLVKYLDEGLDTCSKITFKLDIAELELDVVQAVPIGLILNEAITNCVKYAFPAGQKGDVEIVLQGTDDLRYLLQIRDNGKGLPTGFRVEDSNSLGMNLMHGLSRQLKAELSISGIAGTTLSLVFEKRITISEENESLAEIQI